MPQPSVALWSVPLGTGQESREKEELWEDRFLRAASTLLGHAASQLLRTSPHHGFNQRSRPPTLQPPGGSWESGALASLGKTSILPRMPLQESTSPTSTWQEQASVLRARTWGHPAPCSWSPVLLRYPLTIWLFWLCLNMCRLLRGSQGHCLLLPREHVSTALPITWELRITTYQRGPQIQQRHSAVPGAHKRKAHLKDLAFLHIQGSP